MLRNWSLTLPKVISDPTSSLEVIQVSLKSLARVGMDDTELPQVSLWVRWITRQILFNASTRSWINASVYVERSIQTHREKTIWISMVDPDGLWNLFS